MNPFKPNKNVMLLCVSVLAASVLASTGFAAWVIQGDNTNPEGQGTLNGEADYVFLGDANGIEIEMTQALPSFGTYFFDNGKDNTAIKEAPLEYTINLDRSKMSQTMIDLSSFTLKCTFGLYSKSKKTYYGNANEIVKSCTYGYGNEVTTETITTNASTGSVDLLFFVPETTKTPVLSFMISHHIVIAARQAMKSDSSLTLNDLTFRLSFGLGGNA